jgi:hypothetical protein
MTWNKAVAAVREVRLAGNRVNIPEILINPGIDCFLTRLIIIILPINTHAFSLLTRLQIESGGIKP